MKWASVLQRIEEGEGRATEFKRQFKDLSAIGKAICAFANGEGGLIVIGVDDGGSIVGLNEGPNKVHERLTSFLHTGCSEPVMALCGQNEVAEGRWVHWIEVPSVRGFLPLSCRGRVYIRRERSSVEPSAVELQELFNIFGFVLTEEQMIPRAGINDINLEAFRSFQRAQGLEIEEEPQPSVEDDLRNASVVKAFDDALCPTLYGLMVFGKAPQAHLHTGNFMIRCAAYAGSDQGADVIRAGEGTGRLDEQVHWTLAWIKSFGWTETYAGLLREDRPLIPEPAIREALVNAVVHRDYAITGSPILLDVFDNRIVVTSPGALPNHMTVESVRAGGHPRSRNEAMAHAMSVARLMERRGRGWLTMRGAMREFNRTDPELTNDTENRFVRVAFQLKPEPADSEA